MSDAARRSIGAFVLIAVIAISTSTYGQLDCLLPDNGTGTADFPPVGCDYRTDDIVSLASGLPTGSSIAIAPRLTAISGVVAAPGGVLAGEAATFSAEVELTMTGAGGLAGFSRTIAIPVTGEIHSAPRTLGASTQIFTTQLVSLSGSLTGDPDFDTLEFLAGTSSGLDGGGVSAFDLTGGAFNLSSLLDLEIRIEFTSAPGSVVSGSGATIDFVQWVAGRPLNDDCAQATAFGTATGSIPVHNIGAVLDGPDDCDPDMTTDVWYLYTAVSTTTITIDNCAVTGLLDDTVMIVYDDALGCPVAGSPFIACDDDTCGPVGFTSRIVLPVVAGGSYLIQVGGWNGKMGDSVLTIAEAENCTDGVDNDGDMLVDCDDPDCTTSCAEVCDDAMDNDADGLIDCADPECFGAAPCIEDGAECSDGFDNDGDGFIDCADSDCLFDAACIEAGDLECSDGADNDGDGLVDCDDPGCFGSAPCCPSYAGQTDLIVNQDGIDGDEGAVLDALALDQALTAVGRDVLRLDVPAATASCLFDEPTLENIFIVMGTFPADDRLSQVEFELVSTARQAGKNIYVGSSDHWGFFHIVSSLDAADGVASAMNGDDSVTALDGLATGLGVDFDDLTDVPYTQDVPAGNDSTDRLQTATSAQDPGIVAAARAFGPDDALGLPDFGVV
ncbi:MAG: hypothetical protein KDC38_11415, partial [Planctomycetes bacterium]|nr:hypothetical protein [Planctomycetota bacterium]